MYGYTMTTANDNASNKGRSPISWTLSGSNDGSAWTVIDKQIDNKTIQDVNHTAYSFTCKASDYYQYFKLVITAIGDSNQALQLSELSLNYASDMCAEKGHVWSEGVCTVCGASHTGHTGGTATCKTCRRRNSAARFFYLPNVKIGQKVGKQRMFDLCDIQGRFCGSIYPLESKTTHST